MFFFGQVFPRYFEFSQSFTRVSIIYGNTAKKCYIYIYLKNH